MNKSGFSEQLDIIISRINEHHHIGQTELAELNTAFNILHNKNNSLKDIESTPDHAMVVAQYIASWRFDYFVVIAAMLHDLPIHNDGNIPPYHNIKFSDFVFDILRDFVSIRSQLELQEATPNTDMSADLISLMNHCHSSAFYILIAERIDKLSRYINTPKEEVNILARQTREFLIPLVKEIHAYEKVATLEELCFQIENPTAYNRIDEIVRKSDSRNSYYRSKFQTKLQQIFDNDSKIIQHATRKASSNPPKEYEPQDYQQFIREFDFSKRSHVSLYRYITQHDSSQEKDLSKLTDIYTTAFYDLTLVISDDLSNDSKRTNADLFLCYYEKYLKPEGVFLYGYYYTSKRESCYFLISDHMRNLYRFFLKSESEHLIYLYGDIAKKDDIKIDYNFKKDHSQIKVFRNDGSQEIIPEGSSVLDFAFLIHKDIGLSFLYAELNHNTTRQHPAYTILSNGDTVDIKKSSRITADINWFRYLKTPYAINCLTKYFKDNYFRTSKGNTIKITTRDGSIAQMEDGVTVLDYAFFIHSDMGLKFSHALINGQKKHYSAEKKLKDGDKVIIVISDTITADLTWFRHVKTRRAIDILINYFKHGFMVSDQ